MLDRLRQTYRLHLRSTPMYSHVSLAVTDVDRSKAFYDAALEPLGYPRSPEMDWDVACAYLGDGSETFWIQADADASTPSTRQHVAFEAQSRDAVDAFHEQALEAGGEDGGEPGLRPEYGETYYAAYVTDPDGNRIEAVHGAGE